MRRYFSTPTLRGLHALGGFTFVLCLFAGKWQLGRAQETESMQNYAYALQWPIFAAFVAYMWWRFVRGELDDTKSERARVIRHSPSAQPRTVMPAIDENDPEVVAWNRYLADVKAKKARSA